MKSVDINEAFRKTLNTHGYGFHYAALKFVQAISGQSPYWHGEVAELGVEVRGRDTRVDLVLRKGDHPFYLIIECKRVNPALADWCFARAAWPRATSFARSMLVEVLRRTKDGHCYTALEDVGPAEQAYQVAVEVRTGQRGDSGGGGRGAIEESLGQVCRGLNGFLEFLAVRDNMTPAGSSTYVLPVVFTTAKLWVSPDDIGTADLQSGELTQSLHVEERPWVWCDYPQSPGLKHILPHKPIEPRLADVFYSEFMRRVAVVSASGIEDFLLSGMWTGY